MNTGEHSYAVAIGSNRYGRQGSPQRIVTAAIAELADLGQVSAASAVHRTPALGPAGRAFANAAVILETALPPPALLAVLKRLERRFGRRPGRRWGPRVLDLDIVAWSGGAWRNRGLSIPHPQAAGRAFVLVPLAEIAPDWRLGDANVRQVLARLRRARPVDARPVDDGGGRT